MNLNVVIAPKATYELGTAFSAGVWNGNPGQTRFGDAPRKDLTVLEKIEKMAEVLKPLGLTHVEFHDFEMPPDGAEPILAKVKEMGLKVGMLSGNIFKDPMFAGGALESVNPALRDEAVKRIVSVFPLAVEHAEITVIWNGRMGYSVPGQKDHKCATENIIEGLTKIGDTMRGYYRNPLRIALEPKPNEPQVHSYMATVGEALYLISRLPDGLQPLFGLNPETAHSKMAGLSYNSDLGLAASAKRLFWVHLNGQTGPAFDQDLPFGLDLLNDLETIILLQDWGYDQPLGVDVQPLPSDTDEQYFAGVATSIKNAKRLLSLAKYIDRDQLQRLRQTNNAQEIANFLGNALIGVGW